LLELSQILPLIFAQHTIEGLQETPDFLQVQATGSHPVQGIETSLRAIFDGHQYVDQWQITIEYNDVPFTFENGRDQQDEFFERWQALCEDWEQGDTCEVTITASKLVHQGNIVFVYDSNAFFGYLSGLKVVDCISVVSAHLRKCNGPALFVIGGWQQPAATDTLHFLKEVPAPASRPGLETPHTKVWDRLKGVCHFSGIDDCIALPSDFNIVNAGSLPPGVTELFQTCSLVLLLSVFFDFMAIRENTLTGKLNGYKTFNVSYDVTQLKTTSLPTYYKIYTWLLTGGNLQDKMGIVRNLISLNVDPADNHSLPDTVYPSILSGFKVYERQNIKQYIELRNKMSDQLIGFSEKAGKIVETFAGSFQKSALAVLSLYASVIAVRVLSSKDFLGAFTMEATVLSLVFLLISLVYFFISRWDARQQRLRYIESYNNMKARNEDLLTREDIDKILNNDREYNADLAMIDGKLREYSFMWLCLLALLTVFTRLMFYLNQVKINSGDL
jgi:hypothetical protein